MKCIVCGLRKGKRSCPAKNAAICAQCCGEKRILEIDCPDACEFLASGRIREASQQNARHMRSQDPVKQQKYHRLITSFENFLGPLEFIIAEERHASRSLRDEDVAEALDLVLATLRTESNGILYERTSDVPNAESLRRQIRDFVDEQRHPKEAQPDPYAISKSGTQSIKLTDAIECLEFIRDIVQTHLDDPAALRYVDFLARQLPRRQSLQNSGSGIIIPGR